MPFIFNLLINKYFKYDSLCESTNFNRQWHWMVSLILTIIGSYKYLDSSYKWSDPLRKGSEVLERAVNTPKEFEDYIFLALYKCMKMYIVKYYMTQCNRSCNRAKNMQVRDAISKHKHNYTALFVCILVA